MSPDRNKANVKLHTMQDTHNNPLAFIENNRTAPSILGMTKQQRILQT